MVNNAGEKNEVKKILLITKEVNHRAYKLYKNLKKLYESVHVTRYSRDDEFKGNLEAEVDYLDWRWILYNIRIFSHVMILSSWDQDSTIEIFKGIRKHNKKATLIYESYDWLTSWMVDELRIGGKISSEQYLVKHADRITFRYPGLIKERLHKLQRDKKSVYLPDPLSELDFKKPINTCATKEKALLYIGNVQLDYHRSLIKEAKNHNLTCFINPRNPADRCDSEEEPGSPTLPYKEMLLTLSEIARNYNCYGLIINHSRLPGEYLDLNGYSDDISDVGTANKLFDYLETGCIPTIEEYGFCHFQLIHHFRTAKYLGLRGYSPESVVQQVTTEDNIHRGINVKDSDKKRYKNFILKQLKRVVE